MLLYERTRASRSTRPAVSRTVPTDACIGSTNDKNAVMPRLKFLLDTVSLPKNNKRRTRPSSVRIT